MNNKMLILLAASILVEGCASTTTVAPPVVREAGSVTSITFPIISDQWSEGKVRLAIKNKNGCGEFGGDILPETSNSDFSGEVDGNQDIFFDITRTEAKSTCNIVGTFYATKGNEYTLNLSMKNNQCEIFLLEKTPKGVERKIKTYPSYLSAVNNKKVCEEKNKLY